MKDQSYFSHLFHKSRKRMKNDFPGDNSNRYIYFQYVVFVVKLVVAHNALRLIRLIGRSISVNISMIYMQIYANVIKSSGLKLLYYHWLQVMTYT
jgi:hypothetical protein